MIQELFKSSHCIIETFPIGALQCNTTCVYDPSSKEAIIIDPGFDNPKLIEYVTSKKLIVKKLLHSHAHFDHIGGSWELKKLWGTKNYLHPGDLYLYDNLAMQGRMFGFSTTNPGPLEKDEYIEDNQEFTQYNAGNLKIQAFHTPGHTPGSVSFFINCNGSEQPILLSGDTLFARSIGRTDLPGGDPQLIIKSIKNRLFTLDECTLVVPGHGPLTSIFEEKRKNPFF